MIQKVMRKRFLTIAVAFGIVLRPYVASSDRIPVQAELVQAMEAGRVKPGDSILAKVDVEWDTPTCILRKGAILKGRVVSETPRSKTAKTSDLSLLFESAQCGGRDLKPLALTVAALIAPDPHRDSSLYRDQENQPLSEAVGLGLGDGGSAGAGSGFSSGSNMRSVIAAAATAYVEPTRYKPPKAVLPGQVVGISGVKLSVGSGAEGSSIVSSSNHNVRLDVGSQLVLVPSLKLSPTATAPRAASAPSPNPAPASPLATVPELAAEDETETCAPPNCNVALAASDPEGISLTAATMSVKELGYAQRGNREMGSFDFDAALAYLGSKKLLFTFNPHLLVPRPETEVSPQMRTVRAVLIDLPSMKVEQRIDWRVLDSKQYLWPIEGERVLAHVGRELREYGPALKIEHRLSLDGPLAFVQISPSGKYFAVGVVHERHSRTMHDQLAEAEAREPEEDVEIKVLNAEFRPLATVTRSSRDAPPILSDDGEIRIPTIGKNRWRIVENTWNGQRRVLAQVTSTCRPEVTTLQSDLLFLLGCDRQADGKWYRVLRSDGKTVLKGWSSSSELEQTANSVASAFAVGVAKAAKPIAAESSFRAEDLESENIAVYRVQNGQREFTVRIASPAPTLQTFVLSPDGDQLAVLKGAEIALYVVPATPDHPK